MNYCWARTDAEGKRLSSITLVISLFVLSVVIYGVCLKKWPYAFLYGLCALPALRFWWVSSRKYRLTPDGLTVRYPFGITRYYTWDQFTDVGLCWVHPIAGANTSTLAIRCGIGGEEFGP